MSVEVQHQAQLSSHKWNVSCLEFSPNGLFLASGSWDKTAVIWNLCTLEPSLTFRHHTEPVTSLSWQKLTSKSELGILATTSSDKTVALWNSDNGNLLNNLTHHSSWVLGSDFNNDGKLLASASWDKFVIISDVPTGKPVNTLAGHTTGVWTCAFNPERTGDILCSGADDGSLKLWDIRSNSVVMSLVGGHDDRVKSCAWSPNGEYVASSSADGRVGIFFFWNGLIFFSNTLYRNTDKRIYAYLFL
ncbi:predicted protein [Nematostella vectensis]|uniref:Uncharacterized protein n=1 Tax=Nematostella vectensis TaxID=45351 RepID=A7RF91_NEMVE|nr:predicted protein [Nematostella vectensis]|eukprot:XP_001641977.1 predicted protein [Nematostella vectensis]